MRKLCLALAAISFLLVASLPAQDTKHDEPMAMSMKDCPMHMQPVGQNSHHGDVEKHGDQAMGFPHDKTTHHFLLRPDGGAIEITANDARDKTNSEAIRSHLSHVATMFANGDFATPMFIHDAIPPGVTTMRLLKGAIHYRYEEIPIGGRLRIESADPVAIAAVHDFLRFQISDHETGDPTTVPDSH